MWNLLHDISFGFSCSIRTTNFFFAGLKLIFIVLAHQNKSPQVDTSHHWEHNLDFEPNSHCSLLLNTAFLMQKQQIPLIKQSDTTFTTREGQTRSGVRRCTQSTQGRVRDATVTTLSGIFFLRLFQIRSS
jgi:hypothetical protein